MLLLAPISVVEDYQVRVHFTLRKSGRHGRATMCATQAMTLRRVIGLCQILRRSITYFNKSRMLQLCQRESVHGGVCPDGGSKNAVG